MGPPALALVVVAIHPGLAGRGPSPGERWALPPGGRLRVGLRRTDTIRVSMAGGVLLGGHTAYVFERAADGRVFLVHTGHIGSARVAGSEGRGRSEVAAGDLVEVLTVTGELGVGLRLVADA